MAELAPRPARWTPLLLVLATVLVQLVAAWVLDTAADLRLHAAGWLAAGAVLAAIALNGIRFVIWGYAHRRFPLSQTYPLTALFFPCILALAWLQGDALGASQWLGTTMITAGALWLGMGDRGGKA